MNSERGLFERHEYAKKPCARKEKLFEVFTKDGLDDDEYSYIGKYVDSFMQEKWELWCASTRRQGYKLVPVDTLERTIGHISIAMCHPNNTRNEEDIMHNDMVIIEKAMIGAVDE